MGIWRRRQVEKKDSVVVSGGEGVMATTSTRVDKHDCSYTTISKKEHRQRCVRPIDNPINVSRAIVVVPTGSMPRVGLDDRWFRLLKQSADNKDGSNDGDSSTMVRVAATTTDCQRQRQKKWQEWAKDESGATRAVGRRCRVTTRVER